jgi:hypothetical protein
MGSFSTKRQLARKSKLWCAPQPKGWGVHESQKQTAEAALTIDELSCGLFDCAAVL